MAEKPLISVIMPCYNQAEFLAEALNSVIDQSYENWECIIVNDGSSDDSERIAQAYAKDDSRIFYFSRENGGVSAARNFAVSVAKGEYILPLDADDKISQTYLEKAGNIFLAHPEYTLVYCEAEFFGAKEGQWQLPVHDYKAMLLYNHIFCTSLIRKADLLMAGGYDESMLFGWEDWDLWIRMLHGEKKVCRINEPLFFYRIRENSRSALLHENEEREKKARLQLFMNNQDIYLEYFSDPLTTYRCMEDLRQELDAIKKSKPYKLYNDFKKLTGR